MRWDDHPRLGAESIEDRQWTNLERFAKRMPEGYPFLPIEIKDEDGEVIGKKHYPLCYHHKKKLHKKIKGESANYHFMRCTDCGMMEIMLINKKTGIWMNKNPLSRSPKKIRDTIINFYEAKQ